MMAYETEMAFALNAVKAAALVCRDVQARLVSAQTLQKKDKSPVTVADFASQAIISAYLQQALPRDPLVGEEDSTELRDSEQAHLLTSVVGLVAQAMGANSKESQVLDWIDRGSADATQARYWTLDPVDGTKGFMRGEQYAIALALIEEGEVVLGVLGCPNLNVSDSQGALFSAVKSGHAEVAPLFSKTESEHTDAQPVSVSNVTSASDARFCESVESGHSNQREAAEIARILNITQEPYRIDSQCKYAAVARGDASIYLRLPTLAGYREKIWDHAAGKLVVEVAGGKVTDVEGNALDFGNGRHLDNNRGIIATCGPIHDEVLSAVQQVRAS